LSTAMNDHILNLSADISLFPAVRDKFYDVICSLLDLFFKDASDYARENFIRSCVEQIKPVERLILIKALQNNFDRQVTERQMIEIVEKMFRHAAIYLTALKNTET